MRELDVDAQRAAGVVKGDATGVALLRHHHVEDRRHASSDRLRFECVNRVTMNTFVPQKEIVITCL